MHLYYALSSTKIKNQIYVTKKGIIPLSVKVESAHGESNWVSISLSLSNRNENGNLQHDTQLLNSCY